MEINIIIDEIKKELSRAEILHPKWPTDMLHQNAIMQEEAGEVTKAILDYYYKNGTLDDIKMELIQTAAMCLRILKNI